jgi:hypothetical protein
MERNLPKPLLDFEENRRQQNAATMIPAGLRNCLFWIIRLITIMYHFVIILTFGGHVCNVAFHFTPATTRNAIVCSRLILSCRGPCLTGSCEVKVSNAIGDYDSAVWQLFRTSKLILYLHSASYRLNTK